MRRGRVSRPAEKTAEEILEGVLRKGFGRAREEGCESKREYRKRPSQRESYSFSILRHEPNMAPVAAARKSRLSLANQVGRIS